MGKLGFQEILLLVIALLLLFGAKRIPELAKGIGKGIRDFKDAYKGGPGEEKQDEKKS